MSYVNVPRIQDKNKAAASNKKHWLCTVQAAFVGTFKSYVLLENLSKCEYLVSEENVGVPTDTIMKENALGLFLKQNQ